MKRKQKVQLTDEARQDFNRRFCEVLAEGFENDLIPTDLHNAIGDAMLELITDHANSMALEARLQLPIALDAAQRVEAAIAEKEQKTATDVPAWARPLQESLIAALEDERLPRDVKSALGEGCMAVINGYADMSDVMNVRQFFLPAIAKACAESDED